MSLLDFFLKPAETTVLAMSVADTGEAAAIHASAFNPAWTDGDLERLLSRDHTHGLVACQVGGARAGTATSKGRGVAGFVLYTLAAGEGEILTVATAVQWQRRGVGEKLVKAALAHLAAERAEAMFLEVGDTNAAALGLYRKLGFREVGRRNNYYQPVKGPAPATGASALVLRRDLR
jgi:[ribosomal protein S18]-alanine N-acetyltransferase